MIRLGSRQQRRIRERLDGHCSHDLGRMDEAKREAAQFLAAHSNFSTKEWSSRQVFRREADLQRLAEGYLKAGLPA